jgi:limonene-1,2-epoxide hydrolase
VKSAKMAKNSKDNDEAEFELTGIYSFFNVEEDKNVDWYEFFQLNDLEKGRDDNITP